MKTSKWESLVATNVIPDANGEKEIFGILSVRTGQADHGTKVHAISCQGEMEGRNNSK